MRRAGLDYWFGLWKRLYTDRAELERSLPKSARLHLFTARSERSLWTATFQPGDFLVFGSEPSGLPRDFLDAHPAEQLALPMLPETRSLNLSSAVAVAVYEALRQTRPPG